MKGIAKHWNKSLENAFTGGIAYTFSDSTCQYQGKKRVDVKCLECPLPKCLMERDIPKVRCVITNTY